MLKQDGRTQTTRHTDREVEIKPGFGKTTVLTFTNEGHEAYGYPTSELVVKFKESPNDSFKRKDNDLIYIHKMTLIQALRSDPVHFKTLDGRPISLSVDGVISPQTVKMIKNEGMPIYSDDPLAALKRNFKRGHLYVQFDIQFPRQLDQEKKEEFERIINGE